MKCHTECMIEYHGYKELITLENLIDEQYHLYKPSNTFLLIEERK